MRAHGLRSVGLMHALTLFVGVIAGCTPAEDWPAAFPHSVYTLKQLGQGEERPFEAHPALRTKIDEFLVDQFGTPAEPKIKGAPDDRNLAIHKGSRLYRTNCMYCHGPAGAGNGASAGAYVPPPRDYRRGMFKWKSSLGPQPPLREDLLRTVTNGVPGTSMPAFGRLGLEQREQLVEYVIYLSERGETEFKLLAKSTDAPQETGELKDFLNEFEQDMKSTFSNIDRGWKSAKAAPVPPRNETIDADQKLREESIRRGANLFMGQKANCVKCHGVDGKGRRQVLPNTPVTDDTDVWGNKVSPRDLTEGVYRGGRRLEDTFLRIHQGILASAMPAFGKDPGLTTEEIWDLVRFIRALPYRPDLLPGGKALPEPPHGVSAAQR